MLILVHVSVDIVKFLKFCMRSFEIYSKWSVQTTIHTHMLNAVTLVWDLHRLATITFCERQSILEND